MLPLFKDDTQPLVGHLLSRSLESAGQKVQIIQKNKQNNNKKTQTTNPFSHVCGIQEVLAGGKHFQIVKNMMILLQRTIFLVRLASNFLIIFLSRVSSVECSSLLFQVSIGSEQTPIFEGLKSRFKLLQSQPGEGAKTLNKPFFLVLQHPGKEAEPFWPGLGWDHRACVNALHEEGTK